jgi:hypothetical protein
MACQLRQRPDSTDFEADRGAEVTLIAEDHIGSIMFAKARYGSQELVPAGTATSTIKFTIEVGTKTLVLVFVFAPQGAMGELMEQCGDEKVHLRDVTGDEPRHSFDIEGK